MGASNIFNLRTVSVYGISDFSASTIYGLSDVKNKNCILKEITFSKYINTAAGYEHLQSTNNAVTPHYTINKRVNQKADLESDVVVSGATTKIRFKINGKTLIYNEELRAFNLESLNKKNIDYMLNEKLESIEINILDYIISGYGNSSYSYRFLIELLFEIL
jgi:hypothetical protein